MRAVKLHLHRRLPHPRANLARSTSPRQSVALKGEPSKMMPHSFYLTIMPALCAPRNSNSSRSSKGCCQSGGLRPSPSSYSSYILATWRRPRQPDASPPWVMPRKTPLAEQYQRFQTTLLVHSTCSPYSRWLSSTHCQQQMHSLFSCNCRFLFITHLPPITCQPPCAAI